MSHACRLAFLTILLLSGAVPLASAQAPHESVGTRALGMAGAFVAVADDASATYWNPAGLPGIRVFDATFGVARDTDGDDGPALESGGWRSDSAQIAVATPVLGFSYQWLRLATVSRGGGGEGLTLSLPGRVLRVRSVGVTVVQSVTDALVVGTTLRLLRAGAAPGPVEAAAGIDDALRRTAQLDASSSSHFDADIGALAWIGRLRLGLVVRHATSPEVDFAGDTLEIERQVRAGLSFGGEPARGQRAWAVAADADLTTIALPDGRRRSLAIGGERWWADRRWALRAGARVQTIDEARPAVSGGASVALRTGLLIEAHGTRGGDARDRGWGAGVRLTF